MSSRLASSTCRWLAALTITVIAPAITRGQPAPAPEFTRQRLLIGNFTPRAGADIKLAKRVGDQLRARVGKLLNKREADVVKGNDIDNAMFESNLNADSTFSPAVYRTMGHVFRADEYVMGYVASSATGIRLWGELVLVRDERLRQPLPSIDAPRLDSAIDLFAQAVLAARSQIIPQRQCENALSAGHGARAEAAARAAVAEYPRSTIARTCLAWSLRQQHAPAAVVLTVAQEVLAIDSVSPHALEAAAIALDSLHQRDAAAAMWLRLESTDSTNLDLAIRVARALNDGGNARYADPLVMRMSAQHPSDIRVTQQRWRTSVALRNWTRAAAAGEVMLQREPAARADSGFLFALATSYREAKLPYKAVELLAQAVTLFPKDVRLYSLYTQVIRAEADTALPRGLMLFPNSADLLALQGKELRTVGKLAESRDATKRALAIDGHMPHGHLVIAQLELDLGWPDSALTSLRKAVTMDADTAGVAQFALASGNALYRNASSTQSLNDYRMAYRFLTLADTVRRSDIARFLSGSAALGVARLTVAEASKLSDRSASCEMVRHGADMLVAARAGLTAGVDAYSDMARQSLEYVDRLNPYLDGQVKAFCGAAPNP